MNNALKMFVLSVSITFIMLMSAILLYSGAWYSDKHSSTVTIEMGNSVEIELTSDLSGETVLPGAKKELGGVTVKAANNSSNMYVRAYLYVVGADAELFSVEPINSDQWHKNEDDGFYYYSTSASSVSGTTYLKSLTELKQNEAALKLSVRAVVNEEATETTLPAGSIIKCCIIFQALQTANTGEFDLTTMKDSWGEINISDVVTTNNPELGNVYYTLTSDTITLKAKPTTADSVFIGWKDNNGKFIPNFQSSEILYTAMMLAQLSGDDTAINQVQQNAYNPFNVIYFTDEQLAVMSEMVEAFEDPSTGMTFDDFMLATEGMKTDSKTVLSQTFSKTVDFEMGTSYTAIFTNTAPIEDYDEELLLGYSVYEDVDVALVAYSGSEIIEIPETFNNNDVIGVNTYLFKTFEETPIFESRVVTLPESFQCVQNAIFAFSPVEKVILKHPAQCIDGQIFYNGTMQTLDLTEFNTSGFKSMMSMFDGCSALTNLNLSNFDTSNVTDFSTMFDGCIALTNLDLSNFDTSNVTAMLSMFNDCSSLTSLDLSNFDTSNVTNMQYMFGDCTNLTSLNLSSFNTSNVTDMEHMFFNCSSLPALDLSNFDTSNVTTMFYMFYGCSLLENLNVSNFNTINVTDMKGMFNKCNLLTSLDLTSFDMTNVTAYSDMLTTLDNLSILITPKASKNVPLPTTGIWTRQDTGAIVTSINGLSNVTISGLLSFSSSWKSKITNYALLTSIKFTSDSSAIPNTYTEYALGGATGYLNGTELVVYSADTIYAPASCAELFSGCNFLQSVDFSNFNTDNTTNMSQMFQYCYELTDLDVSGFNTSNVTTMYRMFNGCESLTSLDLTNFDMTNVTNSTDMLASMASLTTLVTPAVSQDVRLPTSAIWTRQDTGATVTTIGGLSNVTLNGMLTFKWSSTITNYASLTSIKFTSDSSAIPSTYTQHALGSATGYLNGTELVVYSADTIYAPVSCASLFSQYTSLQSIDFSNFDTSYTTNMSYMFSKCNALLSLDLSAFNTSNVTDMSYMFNYCSALTNLNVKGFETSKVTTMYSMFNYCSVLASIDISTFNTSNVTDAKMRYVFSNCTSLQSIVIGTGVTKFHNYCFRNCSKLTTVYYCGTSTEYSKIYIYGATNTSHNKYLYSATKYYYSEETPTETGNYWRYVDGVPTIWEVAISE